MAWQEEEREPREGPAHRVVLGGLAAQLALGQELGAICTRAELHVSTRQRPVSGWNGRVVLRRVAVRRGRWRFDGTGDNRRCPERGEGAFRSVHVDLCDHCGRPSEAAPTHRPPPWSIRARASRPRCRTCDTRDLRGRRSRCRSRGMAAPGRQRPLPRSRATSRAWLPRPQGPRP